MTNNFKTVIGLEIHVQLKTLSKMFCGCKNADDLEPNIHICPICLGMPGTLPVANIEAIKKTIKIGLALNSKIADQSKFDRKHYFYPDLPKGYQISQYDQPFCVGGQLSVLGQTVRLNRVHLEEDAGKLIHPKGSNLSIVDLNRAGTPLAEIVTEPDIKSPEMAKEFLKELRLILRQLGVSDADMEKGHLRCDANISIINQKSKIKNQNDKTLSGMSEIVEIKNLNSFKFVEKALSFEQKRLIEKYPDWPKSQTKVTRGFDSNNGTTYSLREKEDAKDYRYFPEPDLPPFDLTAPEFTKIIDELKQETKSSVSNLREQISNDASLKAVAETILRDDRLLEAFRLMSDFDETIRSAIIRLLVNDKKFRDLSDKQVINIASLLKTESLTPLELKQAGDLVLSGTPAEEAYKQIKQNKSGLDIKSVVARVLSENSEAMQKYKSGKTQVIGYLVGEVMKVAKGQADPNQVREILISKMGVING